MKKRSVSSLKKALWKVFAAYIKARDGYICFTCGKKYEGHAMGAGHYIAKAACGAPYYFSEINVNAQCTTCNLKLEGNRHVYRERLIQDYGLEAVIDIEQNYWMPFPDYPYEQKIAEYKAKLAKIQ